MTDCLARHTEFLRAAESPIQKFTALWAVENAVAISQIDLSRTHLIAFEQLCTDPGRILGRLGQFLGVAYGRKSIDLFSQPSGTAQAKARNAAIVPTEEDQRYAAEALERFRLDWLYAGDRKVMPGDLNAKGRRLAENIRDATGHDSSEAVR